MKNPREFKATSWQHDGKIDKSGPDKNLSAHGRPTMVKPSSMDFPAPVPHSGSGYKALGHTGTSMGLPRPMSSDRKEMPTSGMAMPKTNMKSMPDVPKDVKKWHKSNRYDMSTPSTMEAGMKIASKMKAH